jgi:hypothetical protein
MKREFRIVLLAVVMASVFWFVGAEEELVAPPAPYFGLKAPGMVPEVFATGIVSTGQFEFGIAFSRDGRECFFTRRATYEGADNRILRTQMSDKGWSRPEPASFSRDVFEFLPVVSPDGRRLYFYSERPEPPADAALDGDLWVTEKGETGWGDPQRLRAPANRRYCMMVSEAKSGTIYFSGMFAGKRGMFRAACQAGEYGEMERLPEEINAIRPAHPFGAPDESYLIMDAQVTGMGQPELFISFRKADGNWTRALNMGQAINATKTEFAASVSPDGRFLFFHRRVNGNGDIYWVDAGILDELREKIRD